MRFVAVMSCPPRFPIKPLSPKHMLSVDVLHITCTQLGTCTLLQGVEQQVKDYCLCEPADQQIRFRGITDGFLCSLPTMHLVLKNIKNK